MIIPDDMVPASGKIFSGEYDVDIYNHRSPCILDLGANIGSFSRWSKYRWPDSSIYAYEPSPHCFQYLLENTRDLKNMHCEQVAVGRTSGSGILYDGTDNRGMSSMIRSVYTRSTGVDVRIIAASDLPSADIVKCDVEGMELDILPYLNFEPDLILVEFHSRESREQLESLYASKYLLFEHKMLSLTAGCLKFIHQNAPIK